MYRKDEKDYLEGILINLKSLRCSERRARRILDHARTHNRMPTGVIATSGDLLSLKKESEDAKRRLEQAEPFAIQRLALFYACRSIMR